MRDLTLESLPDDEKQIVDRYAKRFADHFIANDARMNESAAQEDARDFISQVWIGMGPQQ